MRLLDSRLAVAMAARIARRFSRIASAANARAKRKQNE